MRISRFLPLIGIAIFLYILLGVDIPRVIGILLTTSLFLFGVSLLITWVDIMLKAYKWQVIFNAYSIPVPYSRFLKSWIVGLSLSLITPGKIGDFAKAYYLKDKAPIGKGLTTVMADRIIDLLTLFFLALVSLSLFAVSYSADTLLITTTLVMFAAFVLAIIAFSKKRIASTLARPLFNRFAPDKYRERMKSVYADFYSGIGLITARKRLIALVTLITFVVWLGTILVIYVVALSLGLPIPYLFLLIVFPIIALLEALPISFSGVGTRDATLIFFFSFLGLTPEAAISISLIYLLVEYLFALVGFGFWYRNPPKIERHARGTE